MASSGSTKYSAMEQGLLALLQNSPDAGLSTLELVKAYYKKRAPRNARQSVTVTMSSLIDKVRRNKEQFIIKRTRRAGPSPVQFWLERKS